MLYAVGSGLIEVLVSTIAEACPFDHKEGVMSLLHSFYCWGSVGVILLSSLFFTAFGIGSWRGVACLFAAAMGVSRVIYGRFGARIDLTRYMIGSGLLCLCCYLLASLARNPVLGLIGCVLCGFSVGIMWPGTISVISPRLPRGGTALFALLAMAGDLGGAIAPSLVGAVSQRAGDNLQTGMLAGGVFPLVLIVSLVLLTNSAVKEHGE